MGTPKKEPNKTLWITLITGVLSLATAVSVAIIQTGSASQDDVDKINSQNDASFSVLVTQINERILPRIERNQDAHQAKLDKLLDEISYLRERIARLEERVGIRGGSALGRMFKPPAMFSTEEPEERPEEAPPSEEQPQKIPRLSF